MSFAAAKTLDEAIAYNDLTPNQSIDPSQILGADVGWARRYAEDPVTPLNWGNSTIHARPGSQWSMDDWCGGPYFDKSTAFAVSDTANLFAINQDTNQWVWIAQLRINNSGQGYPSLNNGVGDIATAPDGTLYLSDYLDLYRLDQNTGLATLIGQFGTNQRINGLAFGPTGELFGSSGDGALYQIDKTTGTATRIGGYGEGYISPGDLVVDGTGQIYATVYDETSSSNYIARINPKNGHATLIGKGFADQIPGLYFFGQQLYGVSVVSSHCSGTGALLTIGTNTGEAKFQSCLTTFDGQRSFNAFGASSVPQATHAQQVKNAYQEHECLEAQQRKHKPSLVEKLYHSLGLIAYSC